MALTACSPKTAPSPATPSITLYTDWYPQVEHGGYYTAQIKGYWKELGLEVKIVSAGPTGGTNPNLHIGKRISLEPNSVGMLRGEDLIIDISRGLPLLAVNSQLQHDALCLHVHDASPVKSFADLSGQQLAVTPGIVYLPGLIEKYKLKNLRTIPIPGSIANFIVDPHFIQEGYATYESYLLAKAGVKSRVLLISESGFDPYRTLAANLQLVREHPDWLRLFSIGAYRGWQEYFRDPSATKELMLRENPDNTPEFLDFAYHELKRYRFVSGDPAKGETMGALTPERWRSVQDQLVALKIIPKALPLEQIFTDAFTPQKLGVDPTLAP
jgi:NitT/TauT family transport system substrate-binding protein